MAEFVQTMKDWRRMCIAANDGPDTTKCGNCPMGESRLCGFEISDIGDYELQEAETFITTWAAEHPEPVYPAWRDWLRNQYPMSGPYTMTDILESPIPADIAQKLGITPKEK